MDRRLSGRIDTLEIAVRELGSRLVALEQRVARMEKRLELVEQRLENVEAEIAALRREHRELTGRVDSHAATREKEAAMLAALEARIARLERHVGLTS